MFSELEKLLFNNSEVVNYLKKEVEQEEKVENPAITPEDFKSMLGMHYNVNADTLETLFKKEAFKDLTPIQINDILTDSFKKLFPISNTPVEHERARQEKINYNNFLKTINGI